MRLLRQFWLSYKGVSLWLNWKAYTTEKIVNPIFRMLFYSTLLAYGYKTMDDAKAFIIANTMALSSISVFKGLGIIFFSERDQGTLVFFVISPSSKFKAMLKKMPFHIIDALATVALGLVVVSCFLKLDFHIFADLFAHMTVGVLALSSFGMTVAALGLLTKDINMLLGAAEMLVFILSGASFPVERLPVFFRWLSRLLPLSHSVESIRYALQGLKTNAWISSAWEATVCLAYLAAAYFALRILEFVARKHGSIDIF